MPLEVMQDNLTQQDDARSITHFLSRVFRKVVRLVIGSVSESISIATAMDRRSRKLRSCVLRVPSSLDHIPAGHQGNGASSTG